MTVDAAQVALLEEDGHATARAIHHTKRNDVAHEPLEWIIGQRTRWTVEQATKLGHVGPEDIAVDTGASVFKLLCIRPPDQVPCNTWAGIAINLSRNGEDFSYCTWQIHESPSTSDVNTSVPYHQRTNTKRQKSSHLVSVHVYSSIWVSTAHPNDF